MNNFKFYDASDIYLRKRNPIVKLNKNFEPKYLNKINTIIELSSNNNKCINYKILDTLYLGDDFVILVNNDNSIIEYNLEYDERAKKEIDLIIKRVKKEEEI